MLRVNAANSNQINKSHQILAEDLHKNEDMNDDTIPPSRSWIRGVNVGGWLLAERFITPYLFAVNSCHLNGELCWYPGQIGAPPNASICDPSVCDPILPVLASDETANYHPTDRRVYMDYPVDEFTLGQTFSTSPQDVPVGKRYMERHWDTFVTRKDILNLKQAGVQYVRVPMGFWIRGDVHGTQEPFIVGGWPYFIRFAKWCREIGLEVWVDLHGAPGSENGFDNSGHFLKKYTCKNWSNNATNVARTLAIVEDISKAIVSEGLQDTVTGFGILNEPSPDCNVAVLRKYYDDAFDIVRSTLGLETAVFIGDMFHAKKFNDGWWGDDHTHYNTFLDSHPYHVFSDEARGFSPRQHIAYVCRNGNRGVNACCYQDHPRRNSIPADGISRIMGEWSAAFDSLPTALVPYIMQHIAATGSAPLLNRTLPPERKAFLRNFVEAQMVAYESRSTGVSSGWLFWNFKME